MTTIHDVAKAAGVSISTVSYALSGKRSIRADTRLRIDAAVRDLGYRANAGARMLAGTRTNILALSAPMHAETHPPAFMSFVVAIATAARRHDYDILLLTEADPLEGLRRVASSQLVDGVVLMDVDTDDARLPLLRELDLPATVVGVPRDTTGLVCVDFDFEEAARTSVRRLADQGHRSIGMVGHAAALYEHGSNFAPRFRDAFVAAIEADPRGLHGAVAHAPAPGDPRGAVEVLQEALPDLTALVLNCNEGAHRAVLRSLADRGLRVPDDVSVVSACSSFDTSEFVPALDVVPLPAEESGRRAVELTMAQLDGRSTDQVQLIAPTWTAGRSTAEVAVS